MLVWTLWIKYIVNVRVHFLAIYIFWGLLVILQFSIRAFSVRLFFLPSFRSTPAQFASADHFTLFLWLLDQMSRCLGRVFQSPPLRTWPWARVRLYRSRWNWISPCTSLSVYSWPVTVTSQPPFFRTPSRLQAVCIPPAIVGANDISTWTWVWGF